MEIGKFDRILWRVIGLLLFGGLFCLLSVVGVGGLLGLREAKKNSPPLNAATERSAPRRLSSERRLVIGGQILGLREEGASLLGYSSGINSGSLKNLLYIAAGESAPQWIFPENAPGGLSYEVIHEKEDSGNGPELGLLLTSAPKADEPARTVSYFDFKRKSAAIIFPTFERLISAQQSGPAQVTFVYTEAGKTMLRHWNPKTRAASEAAEIVFPN